MTSLLLVGFLGLLMQQVSKPLVVKLENAPVHPAHIIELALDILK